MNIPPLKQYDTHELTRRTVTAQEQMHIFFTTGNIVNTCKVRAHACATLASAQTRWPTSVSCDWPCISCQGACKNVTTSAYDESERGDFPMRH